jgi:hypothetical protein
MVAGEFSKAAKYFRGALHSAYSAALGGAYVPALPYELMEDKFMLESASKQNFMQSVPNVRHIPEETATSIAYDICTSIMEGEKTVAETFKLYNAKIPEVYFQDIEKIRATSLYQYFSTFIANKECNVFLGELKNDLIKKRGEQEKYGFVFPNAIPRDTPKFSAQDFKKYIEEVRRLDSHASEILDSSPRKGAV